MIAINLSKQQALDADPRAIKQINFTENLERGECATMFLITEQAKETVFEFSQGKSFLSAKYSLIFISIK